MGNKISGAMGGRNTMRRTKNDGDDDDNYGGGGGGGLNKKIANNFVGLDMSPSEIADTLQNFPMLLLYYYEEVECLLRFMMSPLPAVGSIPSVSMVADRVGGETTTGVISVDCE